MSLPAFALRRPIATVMVYLSLGLIGLFAIFRLPVDLMPQSGPPTLTVFIGVRGGLPPEDIETLVTKIVEDAVATTQHLRGMMSVSRKDRSVVTLTFEPGTDPAFAALEVQERLAKIRNRLPKDIEKPLVAHYSEGDYPVLILSLTSDKQTPEQLRALVDNDLKPKLTRVGGVANIEVGGGRERKILVEFDQYRLEAYGLNIKEITGKIGANNVTLAGGRVDQARDSLLVRTEGQFQSIEDIKKLVVFKTPEGSQVLLRDVAEVRDFYMEEQSKARLNGKPTVSVYVQKENDGNTIKVAQRARKVVEDFKKGLDPSINVMTVSDQSIFIKEAIDNVVGGLTTGAILTWLVIFFFLKEWKHTTVVFVSVPITLLLTFAFMFLAKIALNVMTLSALALAIGMVVDNATVVLENVLEKKRHALAHEVHPDLARATVDGATELSIPLMASTLTIVVVFLPIVFISEQVKILYAGLAFTITFSMTASLAVALTLVPLMASRLPLPSYEGYLSPAARAWRDYYWFSVPWPSFLKRWFPRLFVYQYAPPPEEPLAPPSAVDGGFRAQCSLAIFTVRSAWRGFLASPRLGFVSWVAWSLRRRARLFIALGAATAATFYLYARVLPKDFMGTTEANEFVIFVELPAGAKLEISDQVVGDVEKVLSETPEIAEVVKTAAARVEGWSSKIYVTLAPKAERSRSVQDIIAEVRPKVADIGGQYDAFIYFSEPEASKEFLMDVFGPDYDELRKLAGAIAEHLGKVKGLTDVKLRYKPGRPELQIVVDKQQAARVGLTVKDLADTLHNMIRGMRGGHLYMDDQQFEIITRDQEKFRKNVEDVEALSVPTPGAGMVPLRQVSSFGHSLTPSEVWRKDKQRMIQVSANRDKLPLSSAAKKSMAALKGVEVAPGYYFQVGGDFVDMQENEREFRFAFLIMAVLVFIVLASLFESTKQAVIVMATIPMALIGSIPLLWVTGTPATMGVYIGMIMLGGIVVSAAIILIERINGARARGSSLKRAVLEAPLLRLSPILNTSLTTVVDLFPMVWSRSESAQLWAPLALTVIGGVTVATFLTLFIIPALYYALEKE